MSVAYPIARGAAPALAAAGAVAFFDEPINVWIACGIGLVSSGVLFIGSGRGVTRSAIAWATATGVTIAMYTVIDAQGVRAAPSAQSYIAWIFLMLGGGIGVAFALWRGPRFMLAARSEWRAGLFAGAMSIVTYGLALWAYRLGDTPRLAALRETSIVFAMLIAIFVLKERVTAARAAGIAIDRPRRGPAAHAELSRNGYDAAPAMNARRNIRLLALPLLAGWPASRLRTRLPRATRTSCATAPARRSCRSSISARSTWSPATTICCFWRASSSFCIA